MRKEGSQVKMLISRNFFFGRKMGRHLTKDQVWASRIEVGLELTQNSVQPVKIAPLACVFIYLFFIVLLANSIGYCAIIEIIYGLKKATQSKIEENASINQCMYSSFLVHIAVI